MHPIDSGWFYGYIPSNSMFNFELPLVRRLCLALVSLVVLAGFVAVCPAQIPAFPGAEGAGAYAVGGRYGDVYHVTTLSSSATTPGSFYYGIANTPAAGRTIVFDLSGYIHIGGTYNLNKPKITIAGQTAPGDGIGFKDGTFNIVANDIIIRNIRFRDGNSADAVDLGNNSNIIMDHCDVMLSHDENLSSFGTPPDNFTFQWCMNSWGMETHSCGGLWDQNHATCHHSLWSHNHTRNPKARPALLDWVNNVTFDWDIGFIMGDSSSAANWNANVRGCYFVSPPGNTHSVALEKAGLQSNGQPNFHLYLDDCAMDGDGDGGLSVSKTGYALASGSYGTNATPFVNPGIPVTRDDYLTAYKKVLSAAGPLRMDADPAISLRDELNTILYNNVVQQKRFHVNSPTKTGASNGGFGTLNSSPAPADTDHDGMPDFWESSLGSNANLDDHTNPVPAAAFVPAGCTLLEEYLQFLMLPHGKVAKSTAPVLTALDVDLHKYTVGFTNRLPVTYTFSSVTNGTVTLTNGHVAHFVPPTNFFGRARFDFTVTDGEGSTWKQTFAVLVSSVALPRDLLWQGDGAANNFDTNAMTFLFGTNLTAYSSGDNVTFDNTGANSPGVNITGVLTPGSLTIDAAKNYTLGGSGTLGGTMSLRQSGGGTLIVNNANTFSGNVTIADSTLQLNNGGSVGSGTVTLQSGTLVNNWATGTQPGFANPFVIPDGETGTIYMGNRIALHTGAFTGGGTLNLVAQTTVARDDFKGNAGGLTGTVNILGSGTLRMFANGGAFGGFDNALTVFSSPVHMDFNDNSGGNTFFFGALAGTNTSAVLGNTSAGGAATLQIGALNTDTTFAGQFQSTANLVKIGTGTLTLSGNSSHTGTTTVSNGTLLVTGNFGNSPVTVVNGGTLQGTGFLGGGMTALAGGKISPGLGTSSFGTLTTSNNVTLNSSANLYFDLSGSPGGANDKITMRGGLLTMGNPQNYLFTLTDHALGAGTYDLIDGGTNTSANGVGFVSNLPGGTRQTLALQRPANNNGQCYVRLSVTGSAASLLWHGTNGSAWDLSTTANWLNGGGADKFFNLDSVSFDDTSTNGTVTVSPNTGNVQPAFLVVSNNTRAYTINGGGLAGLMTLVKNGSGMLVLSPFVVSPTTAVVFNSATVTVNSTNGIAPGQAVSGPHIPSGTTVVSLVNSTNVLLSQAADASGTYTISFCAVNSFSGGTIVNGGTLQLVSNPFGGGVGPISLNGATLYLNNIGTGTTLTCAGTNTLQTSGQPYADFSLQGSGVLNLNIGGGGVFSPGGDWGGFSGTINFMTGNWMRELDPTAFGSASAVWNFGNTGGLYNKSGGATISLGAVFGGSGAALSGASTAPAALTTFVIGGINTNSVFGGTISDGGAAGTALVFKGPGSLALTGNNTYSGNTTVKAGTLFVNTTVGSATGSGDVLVASGATLGGSGNIAGLATLADGATLAPGNGAGTLKINEGLVLGSGAIMNFELGTVSDQVIVTHDLSLAGTLNITNLAGFGVGAYTLFSCGGALSLGAVTLGAKPAGYHYSINTNTPGTLILIVAPTLPSKFARPRLSGSHLVLSGTNGIPLGMYYLLTSTNVALPLVNWARVLTNTFDASGDFAITNTIGPSAPQSYYRLQLQ
jgi:autotransporter-associated beta strand protein